MNSILQDSYDDVVKELDEYFLKMVDDIILKSLIEETTKKDEIREPKRD